VKRYSLKFNGGNPGMWASEGGEFVRHDDHIDVVQKLRRHIIDTFLAEMSQKQDLECRFFNSEGAPKTLSGFKEWADEWCGK